LYNIILLNQKHFKTQLNYLITGKDLSLLVDKWIRSFYLFTLSQFDRCETAQSIFVTSHCPCEKDKLLTLSHFLFVSLCHGRVQHLPFSFFLHVSFIIPVSNINVRKIYLYSLDTLFTSHLLTSEMHNIIKI
jgi:hypothetical protein